MWLVCIAAKDNKQIMLCCTVMNSLEYECMHVSSPNILKLFYCGIEGTVRFVLLSFIFCIVTLSKDYFFNLLQWLHEMVGENATRKQEQTALEGMGSQGQQGDQPGLELYPLGHIAQLVDKASRAGDGDQGQSQPCDCQAGLVVLRQLQDEARCRGSAKDLGRRGQSCSVAWAGTRGKGWS